jgi:hypothetical protein
VRQAPGDAVSEGCADFRGQAVQFGGSRMVVLPSQPDAIAIAKVAGHDVHVKVEDDLLSRALVSLE